MAYQGQFAPDGKAIAYSPLPPAFGFDYTSYVSWGNYRGGRASTIWVTTLPGLDSVEIPHETASDFSPVYAADRSIFLSEAQRAHHHLQIRPGDKDGHGGAGTTTVPDIRTLAGEGNTLVYDQLGEIYLYDTATGTSHVVPIEIDADLPEVRPHIENVAAQIDHVSDLAHRHARRGRGAWRDFDRAGEARPRRATSPIRRA